MESILPQHTKINLDAENANRLNPNDLLGAEDMENTPEDVGKAGKKSP